MNHKCKRKVLTPPKLTEAPGKILRYLEEWLTENQSIPTHKELSQILGLSISSVSKGISLLRQMGYIRQFGTTTKIKTERKQEKLTAKQEKLLWYIEKWFEEHQKMPLLREMALVLDISTSSVHYAWLQLEAKGYLRRNTGSGEWELVASRRTKMLDIPVTGIVNSNGPLLFYVNIGTIKVNPRFAPQEDELFGMKIVDLNEKDDAVLIFRKRQVPYTGNIILARLENELIIAKIKYTREEILLSARGIPFSPSARDAPGEFQKISPDATLITIGVLSSIFRNGEYDDQ